MEKMMKKVEKESSKKGKAHKILEKVGCADNTKNKMCETKKRSIRKKQK